MDLDGEHEPAIRTFAYRSLPAGSYTATVMLKNRHGISTKAQREFSK